MGSRRRFGPYDIVHTLGRGGMGVVYLAEHHISGETVALKTVVDADRSNARGIRREIDALRRLSHPRIVRILEDGGDRGLPWYAMEHLAGVSFRAGTASLTNVVASPGATRSADDESTECVDWWTGSLQDPDGSNTGGAAQASPWPPETRIGLPLTDRQVWGLRVIRKLLHPLAYMHGEGVVHQDLKPENILVADDDPTLVDFGLNRTLKSVKRESDSKSWRTWRAPQTTWLLK